MDRGKILVEVDKLKKYFPVKKEKLLEKNRLLRAVDGMTLSIYEGETLGLVGESGCGKSTAAQMIVRLLDISEGSVTYRGRDITSLKGKGLQQLRRELQIVFQDPYASLNPRKKIGWILEEPLHIYRIGNSRTRKERVKEILKKVGLDESFVRRYPHELSGGQRQRVGIAAALMLSPKLVVADEPVSALDVSVQSQILNLLKELQSEFKLTYIFVSHDLNVVHYMSDRVAVMYLGKIVELAEVEAIYENPLHPYTKALLSAIPSSGRSGGSERIVLKGDVPNPIDPPRGCPFHTRCPKVMDRCRQEEPDFKEASRGHFVSCHIVYR